jgi:putative ABC transport system ATP-binding protein
VIEGKKIVKEYFMGDVVVKALRGVSIKIEDGDFVVIVGPSGSGKSTLLHILGALDRPSSGEVFIDDEEVTALDDWSLAMLRREKIGFIFQNFNLIPTLNAVENVAVPKEPTKDDADVVQERAISLLKMVGLGDRMLHKPTEMSGGQRQRVSIARSLINDPEIIFADEPTGNLDTATGKHIIELMQGLNKKEGKTFVIVTHDQSLLDFATKKVFIRDGKIEETKTR